MTHHSEYDEDRRFSGPSWLLIACALFCAFWPHRWILLSVWLVVLGGVGYGIQRFTDDRMTMSTEVSPTLRYVTHNADDVCVHMKTLQEALKRGHEFLCIIVDAPDSMGEEEFDSPVMPRNAL